VKVSGTGRIGASVAFRAWVRGLDTGMSRRVRSFDTDAFGVLLRMKLSVFSAT
jgi:hypothetical protein